MKTYIRTNINEVNFELILFIAFAFGILAGKANAQVYRSIPSGLFVGIEASNSHRTFAVNSDLKDFSGMKVSQTGKTYGITVGSRLINGKLRLGNFSTANGNDPPIQSNSFELGSNFSPLQLITGRTHFLEPYMMLSVETTKMKTNGTFTPPVAKAAAAAPTCSCQCPSTVGGPADPDALPTVKEPVPFSGNFGSTRANVGLGLKAHIQKGKLFLNVFGEMNYGVTLGTTASTQALLNTYVLKQVAFSTGVSLGYIYTKSGHRLRKVSFR